MLDNALLSAVFLSCFFTLLLKTAPITFLQGDSLPALFKRWLDYVPVAVMAALVGPDIFIYDGKLDFSVSNLFLIVSVPTLLAAIISKNYFVTIAVGIGLVIAARYYGFV